MQVTEEVIKLNLVYGLQTLKTKYLFVTSKIKHGSMKYKLFDLCSLSANTSEVTKHLDVKTHRDTVSDRKSHPSAARCYPSTI